MQIYKHDVTWMNECNLFILAWRGNDSRYNTGVSVSFTSVPAYKLPCMQLCGWLFFVILFADKLGDRSNHFIM